MFYKWFSCSECVMFLGKDFFGPLLSWPSRGSWRVVMCVRKHETFKCTNEASGKWQVAGGASGKQQSSKWQEVVDKLRLFGSCRKMPSMPPLLPPDPATRWSPPSAPAPARHSSFSPASAPAQPSQVNCQSHKTSWTKCYRPATLSEKEDVQILCMCEKEREIKREWARERYSVCVWVHNTL